MYIDVTRTRGTLSLCHSKGTHNFLNNHKNNFVQSEQQTSEEVLVANESYKANPQKDVPWIGLLLWCTYREEGCQEELNMS